ncbi:MAG TPA: hypothetical protein VGM37_13230 [Armatimonadota bacterium]|jgi:hypothetical protein
MPLRRPTRRSITLLILLALGSAGLSAFLRPRTPADHLAQPSAYPKGSELYYLAWIRHGPSGQRGGAARKLLTLPNRREYEITRGLRAEMTRWPAFRGFQSDRVIGHMLLIALFDLRPAEHQREVALMASTEYTEDEDVWVKTYDRFEGESVDFMFSPQQEAAIHLVMRGYADRTGLRVLDGLARSFYPAERRRAAQAFRLFPGLPPYDPTVQPKNINDYPPKTEAQLASINKWFDAHLSDLAWSEEAGHYVQRPPSE